MTLSNLLRSHERKAKEKHTHTWFAAPLRSGYTTKTLHFDDPGQLRAQLLSHVTSSPDLSRGCNSISEKVVMKKFVFFADVDVKAEAVCEWARGRPDWRSDLIRELQQLVETCRSTVAAAAGIAVQVIVASRLPYKLHLHFPDVVTDKDHAVRLCAAIQAQFTSSDLFNNAIDSSVYSSGLRVLWCHKGSMTKGKNNAVDKTVKEREAHETLFGHGSWSGVYEITNVDTWEKNTTKSLQDLELTSIIATDSATMAHFNLPNEPVRKRVATTTVKPGRAKHTKQARADASSSSESDIPPQELVQVICKEFAFTPDELNWAGRTRHDASVILPTRSKKCEFAAREHTSNHVYLVLSQSGVDLRCHSLQCKESRLLTKSDMPDAASRELDSELGIMAPEHVTEDMRVAAVTETLGELRKLPEGRNLDLSVDSQRIYRTELGDGESWLCNLPQNRYCPICDKEHDEPQNCVLITMQRLKLLCYKDNFRNSVSVPLLERQGNVIFANQIVNNNLNITVNNGGDADIRDFGAYDSFPKVHEEPERNLLCFKSLTGRTCDVARYAADLMTGKYVYQDQSWYWFSEEEGYWRKDITPDDLLTVTVSDVYGQLHETYKMEKQMRWLNQLRDDLGHLTKRKAFIEDIERQAQRGSHREPLGEKTHLIGFKNGVFDSKECIFRDKTAIDYLTAVIPYDLPKEVDLETRREMERVVSDIMPDAEVRDFLLTMLALHLEGINRHDVAMVWTGVGGNGKGFLKGLMDRAFGPLHREPPATFLTSERPSADKPNPDLVDVKEARSLFTSEPQAGRKINSGFLKYITGRDPIRIRNVHSGTFMEYIPRFLVTLLCNVIPLIEGGDEDVRGIWRRLKIIHFGTIFKTNPNPDRPNEKHADPMLGEKSAAWGPHFMQWLMEIYETYARNGRSIRVPREVEANLQEQKDENSPFDVWLEEHLIPAPGKRVHAHRFDKAYNDGKSGKDRVATGTARSKLIVRGIETPKDRGKDSGCCASSSSIVLNVDVRNWNEEVRSVRLTS